MVVIPLQRERNGVDLSSGAVLLHVTVVYIQLGKIRAQVEVAVSCPDDWVGQIEAEIRRVSTGVPDVIDRIGVVAEVIQARAKPCSVGRDGPQVS